MAELEEKTATIIQLERECQQITLESSSRQAQLNQSLLHMKQVCSQLEARNEELEEQERMLLNNIETLDKRCMELSGRLEGPCQFCKKLEHTSHAKAHQQKEDVDDLPRSLSTPVTPFKSLPEQTEIDKLNEELFKLKEKYECLFANYQMVSEKSATRKKESKEAEKSLTELQGVCDTLKEENEALQLAYKECQRALDATRDQSRDSVIGPTKKPKKIQEESESLMRELSDIQVRHDELLAKKSELQNQLQAAQDSVTHLRSQVSSLKVEKIDNERSLEDARKKLDELMDELHSYQESNNGDECEQHMHTIAACKSAIEKFKKERDGLRERVTELEKLMAKAEEEKHTLSAQNSHLLHSISDYETNRKAVQELKLASAVTAKEMETLQTKLSATSCEKEEVLRENTGLKKKLEETQTQFQELKNSYSKLKSQNKKEQEKAVDLCKELDAERNERTSIEEELQTNKKELTLAKNVIKRFKHEIEDNAKSHDDLESKLLQCRMRIDELEVLNFELESLLADMKNHETLLESKGVKYKEKIEELERKLRAMEEVLYKKECELNDVIISRDLVSKENTSLLEQLDQLSQALMCANSESESLQGQLKHYDGEMQAIVSQISDLEAVHLSCGPAKEKLENEIERLKCQVSSLKEEVAIGREELSSAKLEAKKKTRAGKDLEETVRELEIKLKTERQRNEEFSSLSERQETQLLELTEHGKTKSEQLRQAEKENTRLKSELQENRQAYSNDMERSETRYYKLKEEYDQLRLEKRDLSSKALQLSTDLQKVVRDKSRLETENINLKQENEALQKEKEALQKEVDILKTKVNEAKYNLKHIKKKYEKEHNYEMRYTETVKQYKSLRDEAMTVLSQPDTPTSDRQEQDGEGEGIQQYKITSTSAENLTQDNMSN